MIRLLDYWREQGARVEVSDEGGYWKSRSEEKLRRELHDYDRLIAGLGGLFKDGCDAAGTCDVQAPIFRYKNFEQLEHEGQQLFARYIVPLRKGLAEADAEIKS